MLNRNIQIDNNTLLTYQTKIKSEFRTLSNIHIVEKQKQKLADLELDLEVKTLGFLGFAEISFQIGPCCVHREQKRLDTQKRIGLQRLLSGALKAIGC